MWWNSKEYWEKDLSRSTTYNIFSLAMHLLCAFLMGLTGYAFASLIKEADLIPLILLSIASLAFFWLTLAILRSGFQELIRPPNKGAPRTNRALLGLIGILVMSGSLYATFGPHPEGRHPMTVASFLGGCYALKRAIVGYKRYG